MFSSTVQPSILSLFSSTGSEPLALFAVKTDPDSPQESFVQLLNDTTSSPHFVGRKMLSMPILDHANGDDGGENGFTLRHTVLHIQSPILPSTFIQCPPVSSDLRANESAHLKLKHTWVHIQARNLGKDWSIELGLVDTSHRLGVVRCSTFQVCSPTFCT